MAVKIRLTRIGRTHLPQYRIVAIEDKEARDGKPLEILGNYSPVMTPEVWALRQDRIEYWLSQGAELSDRVRVVLKRVKKMEGAHAR